MNDGLVKILDGNTFVVSDSRGDIEASLTDPTGLFSFDSRFLSTWILTLDGERLNPLSVDDLQYFESRFFLVPSTGTVYVDAKLSVIRRRAVGDGFHEELTILNHDGKPVDLKVRIEAASHLADLFEVKDALQKKGRYSARVENGRLLLGYERETFARQTAISATAPAKVDKKGLTFSVHIEPQGEWTTDLEVVTAAGAGGTYIRPKYQRGERQAQPNMGRSLERWLAEAPRLETDFRPAQGDVPAKPARSRSASLRPTRLGRTEPSRGRPPVVYDDVRPRQHLHQPAGPAVHTRARGDNPQCTRNLAGKPGRRLSRRGSRPDPPRVALRRTNRLRGASPLSLLRLRRRDSPLPSVA
jgi:N-terminal domain of (some) glycogen debranching enzymes